MRAAFSNKVCMKKKNKKKKTGTFLFVEMMKMEQTVAMATVAREAALQSHNGVTERTELDIRR